MPAKIRSGFISNSSSSSFILNFDEQIKSPYVLSVDDCENLYWALTSNDRLLEKIILNVNNNH